MPQPVVATEWELRSLDVFWRMDSGAGEAATPVENRKYWGSQMYTDCACSTRLPVVRLAAVMLGFFLNVPAVPAAEGTRASESTTGGAGHQTAVAALQQLAAQVDRSQFDLDVLLETLDFDDRNIIEFVTREIAFEQYEGSLRGAKGTLHARSGNALDQSVLLAGLLKDAGFEARIVRGELSSDDARKLVAGIAVARPAISPYADPAAAARVEKQVGLHSAVARGAFAPAKAVSMFRQYAARIVGELEGAGIEYGSGVLSDPDLLQQARDYYWVEYDGEGAWQPLHPAWGAGAEPAPDAEPKAYFADAIPNELVHKVSIQAFIDRKEGDTIASVAISDPWERPAANLVGLALTYSNFPLSLAAADFDDPTAVAKSIEEGDLFFPILNGAIAPGAQAFDLGGNVVPPDAAASNYAGVFKQFSKKADQASRALSALGSAKATADDAGGRRTAAQWLQIKLTSPDGTVRSFRRDVAARNGSGRPFASTVAREVTLEIQTGATSTALLLDLVLKRLLAAAPFLEQLRTASDQGEITANVEASVEAAAGQRLETRAYFALADAAAAALPGRRAYRVSPAVVARYQPLYQVLPELDGLDVISDFQRVFPSGGAPSREIVIDQVALGIWQTAIEASVVSWGRSATRNAFLDLQASRSEAPTIAIHGDVDAGSAQGPRAGSPLVKSWWQIDPQTGETLGMIAGGWGGAAPIVAIAVEVPEYLVDTMAVLTQTIGGAKAGRALAVCGGILSLWEVAKIGGAGTGVFEGELIPALPPSVQFIAIGAALILHGADIAGGQVAFMKWCVPKVAFALP